MMDMSGTFHLSLWWNLHPSCALPVTQLVLCPSGHEDWPAQGVDGEGAAEEGEAGNEGDYDSGSPWFGGLIKKRI